MIRLSDEELVYFVGKTFVVEWYRAADGSMEAKEYYDQLPELDQNRLAHLVVLLADSPIGFRLPKTMYNREDAPNKVYAFKPDDYRFFNFTTENRKIIILRAFRKHSQKLGKIDKSLLKVAIADRADYLRRVKEGKYYGRHA